MKYLIIAFGLATLIIYQQCDNTRFSSTITPGDDIVDDLRQDGDKYEQTRSIKFFNAKTDMLFVLDDSCSMRRVLENVDLGLNSIDNLKFAPETNMAVTYMSPVRVNTEAYPDFNKPFYARAAGTPGHMQLVSKNSIEQFLLGPIDNNTDQRAHDAFALQGCTEEWFSPSDVNATGHRCLKAAMQSPIYCTNAEAGVTALDQLLLKKKEQGLSMFRPRANLHVIFVSDTHDAGANMYGRSDTPSRIRTVDEITSRIFDNTPSIQSLRFSGVVRLPVEGHPKLEGVNVIGPVPQSDDESRINSEGDHDFVYLDYIRETEGMAMHANSSDWSHAMGELVTFTETPGSAIVYLLKKAVSVEWVKVNGALIPQGDYELKLDKLTVEVAYDFKAGQDYQIVVRFEAEAE